MRNVRKITRSSSNVSMRTGGICGGSCEVGIWSDLVGFARHIQGKPFGCPPKKSPEHYQNIQVDAPCALFSAKFEDVPIEPMKIVVTFQLAILDLPTRPGLAAKKKRHVGKLVLQGVRASVLPLTYIIYIHLYKLWRHFRFMCGFII